MTVWNFYYFLSTELQALQILQNKKRKNSQLDKNSEIYQEVQAICDTLGIPKSTTSDIPLMLNQVESKVKDILSQVQKNHVGKPLLKIDLSLEQAEQLERMMPFPVNMSAVGGCWWND